MGDTEDDVLLIANHSGRGPVHLAQGAPHQHLAWCGMRTQFRHVDRYGPLDHVTCAKCLRRLRKGHPLSWGATS